jgi:hypothetical protein
MEEVKKKKFNRFTPGFAGRKGGTFYCGDCGKLTRDTGENGSVGLCPDCYRDSIEENVRSDYGEERLQEMKKNGEI